MTLGGQHIVVIGGGIAGVSAAFHLAKAGAGDRITLLEAEAQLAHHTTGRSAALFIENYGEGPVRPLTAASIDFFTAPPAELVDSELITPRGIVTVALDERTFDDLDRQLETGKAARNPVVEITPDEAATLAPHIKFDKRHRVMYEQFAYTIDVAALHQAFVRGFRRFGGEIATSRRVDAATATTNGWNVSTTAGRVQADLIVNAAGPWGDLVAASAGVRPVGLQPLRRTAFMVNSPFADSANYPFVAETNHQWYLGPDGTQFLCSPADETPSEPCDARPEEIDVARTIDMLNEHTHLNIRSVNSQWAGLRTFGPDRAMVVGADPDQPQFIWCVGQGGTGIQTSPGAGRLVADLILTGQPSDHFNNTGLDMAALLPDRVRR